MISAAPYNSLTKEIGGGTVKNIHVMDLWKAVQEVPEVRVNAKRVLLAALAAGITAIPITLSPLR